ncbi:MAG: sensor domain-containing diguanylate cyclase [Solirubrobacteraceae bacterium]
MSRSAEEQVMDLDARTREPLALSLAPFAAAAALAWVTVIVGTSMDWTLYAASTVLLVVSGTIVALRGKAQWSTRFGGTLASLIFLAAVGLLRNAAGGSTSGAAVLSLIPVFYTALFSEGPKQLYVVLAGMTIFYLAPIILVGPPAYPHSQYRAALLTVAVSSIIGLATKRLVASVRHQAGEALSREHMLTQVNEVVRELFNSSEARIDVCEAARTIGQATMAILYEPVRGTSMMRSTAMVGLHAPPIEISRLTTSAVSEAFDSGKAALIAEDVEAHVGSLALWKAAGRPTSILYEPLMRGAEPVGVLVVGWQGEVRPDGARATVVALLAHEAAAAIDRADTLSHLSDMASTDPLTGLPNRRAWDARVNQVLSSGSQFTIAMLDFDHFKEFNDTYGHPAGDRLLKETAAMWREQLRTGDLLARLGGEEFGLLLFECDTGHAVEVIERLRKLIYRNRTCSAGFAERRPGESAEAVIARADQALYEAKSSGRDRVCMSA